MNKVIRIGTVPAWSDVVHVVAPAHMFAKIEYSKDGRLSIMGVIGPLRNGDARGSSGQIVMSFKEYDERGHMSLADVTPAPGWTPELVRQFFDAWDRWHLNDMRAGCEHQRGAEWDTSKKIETHNYTWEWGAYYAMEQRVIADGKAHGVPINPKSEQSVRGAMRYSGAAIVFHGLRFALGLEPFRKVALDPAEWDRVTLKFPDAENVRAKAVKHTVETKTAGWLSPSEHPSGLLGKPCGVCGYKYGTAWKREDVPAAVIEFLQSLPDADVKPAWV